MLEYLLVAPAPKRILGLPFYFNVHYRDLNSYPYYFEWFLVTSELGSGV